MAPLPLCEIPLVRRQEMNRSDAADQGSEAAVICRTGLLTNSGISYIWLALNESNLPIPQRVGNGGTFPSSQRRANCTRAKQSATRIGHFSRTAATGAMAVPLRTG